MPTGDAQASEKQAVAAPSNAVNPAIEEFCGKYMADPKSSANKTFDSFTNPIGEVLYKNVEKAASEDGTYNTIDKQAKCLASVVKDGTDRAFLPPLEIKQMETNSKSLKDLLDVIGKEGLDTDSAEPLISGINQNIEHRGVELRYDSEGREPDGKFTASLTLYDKAALSSDKQGLLGFKVMGSAESSNEKP